MSSSEFCSRRSISRIPPGAYVLACVRLCSALEVTELMAFLHLARVKVHARQVQVLQSLALRASPVLKPLLLVVAEPLIELRGLLLGLWLAWCLE